MRADLDAFDFNLYAGDVYQIEGLKMACTVSRVGWDRPRPLNRETAPWPISRPRLIPAGLAGGAGAKIMEKNSLVASRWGGDVVTITANASADRLQAQSIWEMSVEGCENLSEGTEMIETGIVSRTQRAYTPAGLLAAVLFALAVLGQASKARATLYAVDFNSTGNLYSVDTITGP